MKVLIKRTFRIVQKSDHLKINYEGSAKYETDF